MPTASPDNPYATPSAADMAEPPEAPPSHGWEMRGARLWVEEGALLPMIDPFTGGTADRMKMRRFSLRLYPWWFYLLLPVGTSLGAAALWETEALTGALNGGVMGLFAMVLLHWFLPVCHVRLFVLPATLLSRTILSWIMTLLFAGFVFAPVEDEIWWVKAVCGGAWLILWLRTCFIARGLRCRNTVDGWFEIRGVHPAALAQLIIHPATRNPCPRSNRRFRDLNLISPRQTIC